MAALSSLSESVYSCLSLIQQRQIWRCIQVCSADCASAVQAAALKAMGTLAMCPSSQTYPGTHRPVAQHEHSLLLVFIRVARRAQNTACCS